MITKDNSLFDFYSQKYTFINSSGFLNIKKLKLQKYKNVFDNIDSFFYANKKYYVKSVFNGRLLEIDAEILTSQIFAILGFDTAIYLPVLNNCEKKSVCSQDIVTTKNILTLNCSRKIISQKLGKPLIDFLNFSEYNPDDFLTKRAIAELLKMLIIDIANGNRDRHGYNAFAINDENNKISKIIPIDNADSSNAGYDVFSDQFQNEFITKPLSPSSIIDIFTEDYRIHKYVSISDIIEMLRQVKIEEICSDIEHTIGYQINGRYADILSKRYKRLEQEFEREL